MVGFARTQHNRRPLGFVGRIGIMLSLEAQTCTLIVDYATLSGNSAVKEVAQMNLLSTQLWS